MSDQAETAMTDHGSIKTSAKIDLGDESFRERFAETAVFSECEALKRLKWRA